MESTGISEQIFIPTLAGVMICPPFSFNKYVSFNDTGTTGTSARKAIRAEPVLKRRTVGPSLRVLQKRALDVSKLLLPYEPTELTAELAARKAADPGFPIEQAHLFPLGGIKTCAEWAATHGGEATRPARRAI